MTSRAWYGALAVTAASVILQPARARAEVKVDALIGDHMVIQRDRPVRLGGTAAPGEAVTATLAAGKASTKADAHGRWTVSLPALTAGGPFMLRILGANAGTSPLTFNDVMVGEVWVAAGQSNMELPLQRTRGGADAAALGCSGLRLFTVANRPAAAPVTTVRGEWCACDAASAPGFSAAAFYFGRDLHRTLGVPVGIVQSSVGGTPAEGWTPREALHADPTLAPMLEALDRAMNDPTTRDELAKKLAAWEAKNFYQDDGNGRQKAEKAGWARAGGGRWPTTMQLPQLWEAAGLTIDGAVWFRREVTVPEAWAGKDLALSLGAVDDFDVTYWNGERVGATGAETPEYWSTARHYQVPARLVKAGRNVIAVRVFDHFGGGGFAGSPAQMNVKPAAAGADDAPLALAGTWTYKIERKLKPIVADWSSRPKLLGPDDQTSPTVLWNAMVAPFAGTPVAGVIWYQGESNAERAAQYRTLFPAMIRGWRAAWGDAKLPFLFVQLPNFEPTEVKASPGEGSWAELREAQALALREPRTAMAVTLDIGEAHDVHPREKQEVGRRLALAALKLVYGRDVIAAGPTFAAAIRDGAAIKIRFTNVAGGLTTSDGAPPRGFLIAGADRVWKTADARIEAGTVIVKNAEIAEPVAVRYGWGNNPGATLRSQADLPAAPFRTDDWATASVTATAK
jgi:sialate O-acetylesterase